MLQQFSWGAFLIASIVLNLIWYFFVVVVFYRKEFLAFLGRGTGDGVAGKGLVVGDVLDGFGDRNQDVVDVVKVGEVGDDVKESLMGGSRLPDGVVVRRSGEVAFAGLGAGGDVDRYEQVGLVADVVQELKLIFDLLERSDGGKREFLRLVAGLREVYGSIGGHPSIGSINDFIRGAAPFSISLAELEDLWF